MHLLVLLALVALSALVFVLATGFRAPRSATLVVPEENARPTAPLGASSLALLATALLDRYGLAIETRVDSAPRELTLVARSDDPLIGGRYIVVCRSCEPGEIVTTTRLLEFRDEVKASGATKGLFLTDGFFTSDARYLLDDAPVSLVNRGELGLLEPGSGRVPTAVGDTAKST